MSEADWILEDLTNALRWAMFYAEHGHEAMHPKETYAKDGNVAISVDNARRALLLGEGYLDWIRGKPEQLSVEEMARVLNVRTQRSNGERAIDKV